MAKVGLALLVAAFFFGGATWRYARIGQPEANLLDFFSGRLNELLAFAAAAANRPSQTSRPNHITQAEQDLSLQVEVQGLCLNQSTVTDGNCGLDAILRNLERLNVQSPMARRVLSVLQARGRQAALRLMRDPVVGWLRQNQNQYVVPDFIYADLATQGSVYPSLSAYLTDMKRNGVWIDTTGLYAMSALFQLQIPVFCGPGKPELIETPCVLAASESPIAVVANANTYHFWACCEPSQSETSMGDPVQACEDRCDVLSPDFSASRPCDPADYAEDCCAMPNAIGNQSANNQSTPSLHSQFCRLLIAWSPFATSQSNISAVLPGLRLGEQTHDESVLQLLRWRPLLKTMQCEEWDLQHNLGREHQYRAAESYIVLQKRANGLFNTFKKSKNLCAKLQIDHIIKALGKDCTGPGTPL